MRDPILQDVVWKSSESEVEPSEVKASYVPVVLESDGRGERSYDLFSRMLQDRIIFLNGEVNDGLSSIVVAQLLWLDSRETKDIYLYINSPGGSVSAGLAMYDTMKYIKSDVITICTGLAASMGAFLLTGGTRGKRIALPNSKIMIHQPSGGARGQATDMLITVQDIMETKNRLNRIMAANTGQSLDKITQDMERDFWMTVEEALAYGIIDSIVESKREIEGLTAER
jgi:ATP-dependent Clp protease protease subunit